MTKLTTVFLTGGSGHLGYHVAQALIRERYKVNALVRRLPNGPERVSGVNYFVGDMLDLSSYATMLQDSDAVIHTAAEVTFGGRADQLRRINVDATKVLLEHSRAVNVSRFIYVSSRGTRVTASDPKNSDESGAFLAIGNVDAYIASKLMAERAVIAASDDMTCIVVSPTALVGGRDRKPGPAGALVKDFVRGHVQIYLDGGFNLVDVHDAADATVATLTRGCNGDVYFLGGSNISMLQIYRELANLTGNKPPAFKIPTVVAYFAASVFVVIEKITGRPAQVTPKKVLSFRNRSSYCDSRKALEILGMPQTPLKETLEDAIHYFRA